MRFHLPDSERRGDSALRGSAVHRIAVFLRPLRCSWWSYIMTNALEDFGLHTVRKSGECNLEHLKDFFCGNKFVLVRQPHVTIQADRFDVGLQ